MRICVLHPQTQGSASPFAPFDPPCDPARYATEHEWSHLTLGKRTAGAQLRHAARDADLFLNLCDGAWDEDRPGIDVVRVLEQLGLPFTGAASDFYEPTREAMKRVCRYYGIDTPAWRFATSREDILAAEQALRFPMIVKHPASYGSVGMTRDSRVTDMPALLREGGRFLREYDGVLIEEFIEGREFTALVSERIDSAPDVYRPVECRFPPGESFKHFDLKWVDFEDVAWSPVVDDDLACRIGEATSSMFMGLNGSGYGRADMRMDADARLFMLEMNPQPGVFYPAGEFGSADFILSYHPGGHREFLDRIMSAGLTRHRARQLAFDIRDNGAGGYGMFAARDLGPGECIDRWEERPQRLVSRQHAEQWTGKMREWFHAYAWQVGEDVFAIWAEDPLEWRPLDHSCDPNAWLSGLDLVARRPIARGEPITADYGTFCGEIMTAFTCQCGASACRGVIRGDDWRLPRMGEYGVHVSPWVAARRNANLPQRFAEVRGGLP